MQAVKNTLVKKIKSGGDGKKKKHVVIYTPKAVNRQVGRKLATEECYNVGIPLLSTLVQEFVIDLVNIIMAPFVGISYLTVVGLHGMSLSNCVEALVVESEENSLHASSTHLAYSVPAFESIMVEVVESVSFASRNSDTPSPPSPTPPLQQQPPDRDPSCKFLKAFLQVEQFHVEVSRLLRHLLPDKDGKTKTLKCICSCSIVTSTRDWYNFTIPEIFLATLELVSQPGTLGQAAPLQKCEWNTHNPGANAAANYFPKVEFKSLSNSSILVAQAPVLTKLLTYSVQVVKLSPIDPTKESSHLRRMLNSKKKKKMTSSCSNREINKWFPTTTRNTQRKHPYDMAMMPNWKEALEDVRNVACMSVEKVDSYQAYQTKPRGVYVALLNNCSSYHPVCAESSSYENFVNSSSEEETTTTADEDNSTQDDNSSFSLSSIKWEKVFQIPKKDCNLICQTQPLLTTSEKVMQTLKERQRARPHNKLASGSVGVSQASMRITPPCALMRYNVKTHLNVNSAHFIFGNRQTEVSECKPLVRRWGKRWRQHSAPSRGGGSSMCATTASAIEK